MTRPAEPSPTRPGSWPLRVLFAGSMLTLAIVVSALPGDTLRGVTGYDEAARAVLLSDWWTLWTFPPVEFALIVLLVSWVLPAARAAAPQQRRLRTVFAAAALATLVLAVASPIGGLARGGMFAAHMTQHVLVGAVAPLLVLLALRRVIPGAASRFPRLLARLLHPVPAFVMWTGSTLAWLFPAVHHQVYMHQTAWTAQQISFFVFGIALWAPVTERLATPPRWFGTGMKCLYMVGVWSVGLTLANVYWFSGAPFYPSHTAAADAWGISALQDQANAATVMMATHCLLAFGAIVLLFFRQAREDGLEQRLVEAGLDAQDAHLGVHYGDPAALAREAGIPLSTRGGID